MLKDTEKNILRLDLKLGKLTNQESMAFDWEPKSMDQRELVIQLLFENPNLVSYFQVSDRHSWSID